jgi:hypothetical protein
MFRRFTDRVTAAVYGDASSETAGKVRALQSMGFDAASARNALAETGGDVDSAAVLLLRSPSPSMPVHVPSNNNQDEAMRNAMEESLQTEDQRLYRQAQEASLQPPRAQQQPQKKHISVTTNRQPPASTAAATKSGQAAASRATTRGKSNHSLIQEHHPNVKVPTKLEDKSKEEQITRNANRVKGHPAAVDTLYKALTALRNDPNNQKFRRIDKSNPGYQRSLAPAPGAEALLLNMNFTQFGPKTLVLDRSRVDPVLLFLGISALEEARNSVEYQEAKRQIQFTTELKAIHLQVNSSVEEAVKRANFISACPTEPPAGRGARVQVGFGEDTIRRRFDGDDVLQDVLNWLGGHGSVIPDKLLSRDWCLVDMNRYPISPIDVQVNVDKTLQYVGFWPSGKLEIRPSPVSWLDRSDHGTLMGSSRGLGAAPSDTLR